MNNSITEISIIGLGRFGAFWAEQLCEYFKVYCYDSDESKTTQINSKLIVSSLEECLAKEYIFLTLPIRGIRDFFQLNRDKFNSGTTIVDCASVKVEVLKWQNEFIPDNVPYISLHPLFGPDSAQNGVKGHTVIYTNENFASDPLFSFLSKRMGIDLVKMSPEEHDLMMAYNLNLVHLLGRTLNDLNISDIPIKMKGIKYLDEITRFVMNDNKELFQDFFTYNPYAKTICREFANSFNKISSEVTNGELVKLDHVKIVPN